MNEIQMGIAWQFFFLAGFLFLGMITSLIAGWWFVSEAWDLLKFERATKKHALEHYPVLVRALKDCYSAVSSGELERAQYAAYKVLKAAEPDYFMTKEQWLETL